jgi:hypothetical protein
MAALVLAIAGTAIAGSTHEKVTRGKVKAIATKQITSLASGLDVESAKTAGTADTARTAGTAHSADTAGSAKIATNILSANVRSDGTMVDSVPGGATSSKNAEGDYRVDLGRDITGCTLSASAASTTSVRLAIVAVGVIDGSTLQVFTRTSADVVADEPFYVQAICPA